MPKIKRLRIKKKRIDNYRSKDRRNKRSKDKEISKKRYKVQGNYESVIELLIPQQMAENLATIT